MLGGKTQTSLHHPIYTDNSIPIVITQAIGNEQHYIVAIRMIRKNVCDDNQDSTTVQKFTLAVASRSSV